MYNLLLMLKSSIIFVLVNAHSIKMTMKLLQFAATTAALASFTNGLSLPRAEGAFSIDAISSTSETFDPAAELEKLQAKFPTTSDVNPRTKRASTQQGSAKVNPSANGLSFYVPTVIGNQTFNLIFDTGSADL